MGTEAGYAFATGHSYIKFDEVLAILEGYKQDYEAHIKLSVAQKDEADDLAAELFGGEAVVASHFCNPYEAEIALLTLGMEMIEAAREATIRAITNDTTEDDIAWAQQVFDLVARFRQYMAENQGT